MPITLGLPPLISLLDMSQIKITTNEMHKPSIDTYSTAINWNSDTLFDDVIDPFEQIASSEREKGRQAGRASGYVEGRDIGLSKGWEIGLELGYIHGLAGQLIDGFLNYQQQQQSNATLDADEEEHSITSSGRYNNQRLDRCLTISRELMDMIDSFPDPNELLKQESNISEKIHSVKDSHKDNATTVDETQSKSDGHDTIQDQLQNDSESVNHNDTSIPDVTALLQRIRAKFKLLLVLLRTNTPLDLKRLLNPHERDNQIQDGNDEKGVFDDSAKQPVMKGSDW
eukprot:scaffold47634_cov32-Cyclotella_meneghiniana.AAC.5